MDTPLLPPPTHTQAQHVHTHPCNMYFSLCDRSTLTHIPVLINWFILKTRILGGIYLTIMKQQLTRLVLSIWAFERQPVLRLHVG